MATCTIPEPITDLVLTAINVTEPSPGEVAWDGATSWGLGAKVIVGAPSHSVTITVATPAVVTWAANGLPDGTPVSLSTTGALPAGLAAGVIYYVVNRTTDTFQLSEELGGAPLATTSAGAGVHTAKASIHRAFQSLIAGNVGNPPALAVGDAWFDLGPTNRQSMIDLYRPSITWWPSPLTFTLTPRQVIRSLFFGKLVASQIDIVQKRGGVVIKTWSRGLLTRTVRDFEEYWYKPFTPQQSVQLLDLLLYADATLEVTITRDDGRVGIGEVVMGNPVKLGKTRYGAKRSYQNYSKFDRNTDGSPQKPVRRRNVPSASLTILFDKLSTTALLQVIDDANGQVVVTSGLDDDAHPYFEPTLILGLIRQAELDLSDPDDGVLTWAAEEY
jgi:hypothetical protein